MPLLVIPLFSSTMYAKKVWAIGVVAKILPNVVPKVMEIVSRRGPRGALNLRLGLCESSVAHSFPRFDFKRNPFGRPARPKCGMRDPGKELVNDTQVVYSFPLQVV